MQFFETKLCIKCRGKNLCRNPCKIYSKIKDFSLKTKTHFSGISPPEIFIGRYNYPNINAGILSPDNEKISKTQEFSMPEIWYEKKFSIEKILSNRIKMIYGKFKTQIKKAGTNNNFTTIMQEISMAYKPVSTEFFLKNPPKLNLEINKYNPVIGNPATLQFVKLQENPKVKPKVDSLISDIDIKSVNSINELYKSKIPITSISKMLSAGLLGLKTQRKLVPTRWSITATDDTISKELLEKIKYYSEINEILLFHNYYVGNHYEILLLPEKFSFEVLEAYIPGSLWNQGEKLNLAQDYEGFTGRKKYAFNVTGAYYTARLVLCEYLEKIKRQAYCIVFREERPEYYAPLGMGILRELARGAFKKKPEKFESINQALNKAQTRLKLPIKIFKDKSALLKEYGKQKKLKEWI